MSMRVPVICPYTSLTYLNCFITGNKKDFPWGFLIKDLTSWMLAACILKGFKWKDPSKIQVGVIFHLLGHWRNHKDQGLEPLYWVPTSPLFKHTDPSSKDVWTFCTALALDPHDSDEQKDSQMTHKSSDHVSAVGGSSGDGWQTSNQDEESVHKPSDHIQ